MKTAAYWLAIVLFAFTPTASAVEMDWTLIGDPGNPADTEVMTSDGSTGYGSVPDYYRIGTYEVTNAQYVEFLNAKAASDPLGLYHTSMAGITRSGPPGSYIYDTLDGMENLPVNLVSFYDAARFANWLNNGQGSADTESGAYTLLGGTPTPSNGLDVTRNAEAAIFVPSEDEWYKAAYYDAATQTFFDYPAGNATGLQCTSPTTAANSYNCNCANCGEGPQGLAAVGSYPNSASPSGTFDQGGNAFEWTDTLMQWGDPGDRQARGGGAVSHPIWLKSSTRVGGAAAGHTGDWGFRVAPEPTRGVLFGAGIALLVLLRPFRRR